MRDSLEPKDLDGSLSTLNDCAEDELTDIIIDLYVLLLEVGERGCNEGIKIIQTNFMAKALISDNLPLYADDRLQLTFLYLFLKQNLQSP